MACGSCKNLIKNKSYKNKSYKKIDITIKRFEIIVRL